MLNKTVLYALGLLLAVVALLLSGGMGRHHWLGGMGQPERATLRVLGGAPFHGAGVERGAGIRFELSECASAGPTQSVTIPLWADSMRRFRAFSQLHLRPEVAHRFGDVSWQVAPGCYRVRAHVVDQAGTSIATCNSADSPNSFLETGDSQNYVFLLDCATSPEPSRSAGVRLEGILNRPPRLDPIEINPLPGATDASCSMTEVCATAHDLDGDPLKMEWTLRSKTGRLLPTPTPRVHQQHRAGKSTQTECLTLPADTRVRDIDVSVRDLSGALPSPSTLWRGAAPTPDALLSFEDLYLGDFGLIATSGDRKSRSIDNTCDPASCPEDPAERIRSIRYWIARDGRLLTPTTDLSQVREGDTVDVEFDIAPGCQATRVNFSSFHMRAIHDTPQKNAPETTISSASNTYDPGTHILWNLLPNCQFRVEFRVAQTASADTPAARIEASEHALPQFQLIDSFDGGERPCPKR